MACAGHRSGLSEVAIGGPAPAFAAHLQLCTACRSELARLRRALALADESLRQLSSAEPSPAFAPRVRAAVSAFEPTRAWWADWRWPSLATAAALVVALILVTTGLTPPPSPATVDSRQLVSTPTATRAADSGIPDRPSHEHSLPSAPAAHRQRVQGSMEVLIPAGELHALREFAALVNRENLAPDAFGAAGVPSAPLALVPAIQVKPVEIVPLDLAPASGT